MICLGQKLHADGSLPHSLKRCLHVLRDRIIQSRKSQYRNSFSMKTLPNFIIFTGGSNEVCGKSEANAMWEYFQNVLQIDAVDSGYISTALNEKVPYFTLDENITVFLEEHGHNTVENLVYSLGILESLISTRKCKPTAIQVMATDFHSPRSILLGNHILGHLAYCTPLIVCSYDSPRAKKRVSFQDSWKTDNTLSPTSVTELMSSESFKNGGDETENDHIVSRLSHSIYMEKQMLSKTNQYLCRYGLPTLQEDQIIATMQELDDFERSVVLQYL